MSYVLLSASGNETAEYCNGAMEAAVMEAIARQAADYMRASGLRADQRPKKVPSHVIASVANRENADLLLLLRSSVAPMERVGEMCGTDICFHPAAQRARALSALLQKRIAPIAPEPGKVNLLPAPQVPDFRMARCPTVLLCLGYRDCPEDAVWMLQSTGAIAHALAWAVADWFGLSCASPFAEREATVRTPGGSLALRRAPHRDGGLLQAIPNGAALMPLHPEGDWQYVQYEEVCGYVLRRFLTF